MQPTRTRSMLTERRPIILLLLLLSQRGRGRGVMFNVYSIHLWSWTESYAGHRWTTRDYVFLSALPNGRRCYFSAHVRTNVNELLTGGATFSKPRLCGYKRRKLIIIFKTTIRWYGLCPIRYTREICPCIRLTPIPSRFWENRDANYLPRPRNWNQLFSWLQLEKIWNTLRNFPCTHVSELLAVLKFCSPLCHKQFDGRRRSGRHSHVGKRRNKHFCWPIKPKLLGISAKTL